MSTMTDVDRERRAAQHARENKRSGEQLALEALYRARDAFKHNETKLLEREIDYAIEKLEKVV